MYRVLYRKWRPKVFSDVIGQPQVTQTLSSQIKEDRLAHAYLFTGSRGTGKTTCAKIFSKAVNCLHPVDGNPCNECEICKGIDSGSVLDIVEIDAASNRSIDDIRMLKDEANFTPSQAKYRVYIIDEVHMLTIEAFNALLKILEEPPAHVKFVLATTEVQKLPATILSRCQRFDFRRIEPEDIADRLMYISDQEGAKLDREAALLIARIADGGMRDALSLLDRCISVNDNVTVETVSSSAGLMGREHIYNLVRAIADHDTEKCLILLDDLHKGSCDTERLCSELIDRYRSFLIVKTVEKPENLLICTSEELDEIKEIASGFSKDAVLYGLNVLTGAADAMHKTQNRRIELEMALIRLCKPENDDSAAGLAVRIGELEKEIAELKKNGVAVRTVPVQQSIPAPVVKQPETTVENKENIAKEEPEDLPFEPDIPPFSDDEAPPVPDDPPFEPDEPQVSPEEPAEAPVREEKKQSDFTGFESESKTSTFADKFKEADDEGSDDDAFDFDAFMKEHAGNAKKDDSSAGDAGENGEEGDDDFVPPFDDSDAPPVDFEDIDDIVPDTSKFENSDEPGEIIEQKKWAKIIYETESSFPPLIGQLTGSHARIEGSYIHITLGDKNYKFIVREDVLFPRVAVAAKNVLGKEYKIKID